MKTKHFLSFYFCFSCVFLLLLSVVRFGRVYNRMLMRRDTTKQKKKIYIQNRLNKAWYELPVDCRQPRRFADFIITILSSVISFIYTFGFQAIAHRMQYFTSHFFLLLFLFSCFCFCLSLFDFFFVDGLFSFLFYLVLTIRTKFNNIFLRFIHRLRT